MREFEIGDEVVLMANKCEVKKGEVGTITDLYPKEQEARVFFSGDAVSIYLRLSFVKHKYPNPPHKHMKEIIEWAKGADIGRVHDNGDVHPMSKESPHWFPNDKYEVIEPTPPKTERELKIEEIEAKMADITKQVEELK